MAELPRRRWEAWALLAVSAFQVSGLVHSVGVAVLLSQRPQLEVATGGAAARSRRRPFSLKGLWVRLCGVSMAADAVALALMSELFYDAARTLHYSGPLLGVIWLLTFVSHSTGSGAAGCMLVHADRARRLQASSSAELTTSPSSTFESKVAQLVVATSCARGTALVLGLAGVLRGISAMALINFALLVPFAAVPPAAFLRTTWPLRHRAPHLPPEKAELLLRHLEKRRRGAIMAALLALAVAMAAVVAPLSASGLAVCVGGTQALWVAASIRAQRAMVLRERRRAQAVAALAGGQTTAVAVET